MRSRIAAAVVTMLVAACNNNQPQQAQPNRPIAVRGPEQERLHKLSDLNRAIALKRAIYDAGYTCGRVTESRFVGAYKNLDEWMVKCADGHDWAVFTGPDGSAQVRDCRDVNGLGLPQCEPQTGSPAAASKAANNAT